MAEVVQVEKVKITYKPPFPYFGGKSRIAPEVWRRFGGVRNFVDPFCGSLAMIFLRPEGWVGTETVNDLDGFICNFWRAVQRDPSGVARYADNPVNECDLHARHVWLKARAANLSARLMGDPHYYDAKIAGWWCWGLCCWIGHGWCDPKINGPWSARMVDGTRQLARVIDAGRGVRRKQVHLGDAGRGVNRQRVDLGSAGKGVNRQLVHLGNAGQGVNRQLMHLGDAGRGVNRKRDELVEYFTRIATRLESVRVCSGDWKRVVGPCATTTLGLTAVFLDPPYSAAAGRDPKLYGCESDSVARSARDWAAAHGNDPKLRIALCGYEGEHDMPSGWTEVAWKARGGYGSQRKGSRNNNAARERIWFSPNCLA